MSKEFEEIVLKKLEKLDDLDTTMQDVVLKKLEKLDDLDTTMQDVVLKKLEKLDDLNTTMQDVVLKKLEKLDDLEKEVKSNQECIKKLNDNFTVFDFEINKKIDTLFDAITANNEKHELFEKSIISLNTKTFNHDIRISVLEDYGKNEKLFATN